MEQTFTVTITRTRSAGMAFTAHEIGEALEAKYPGTFGDYGTHTYRVEPTKKGSA